LPGYVDQRSRMASSRPAAGHADTSSSFALASTSLREVVVQAGSGGEEVRLRRVLADLRRAGRLVEGVGDIISPCADRQPAVRFYVL
jgi:hypothetical protein